MDLLLPPKSLQQDHMRCLRCLIARGREEKGWHPCIARILLSFSLLNIRPSARAARHKQSRNARDGKRRKGSLLCFATHAHSHQKHAPAVGRFAFHQAFLPKRRGKPFSPRHDHDSRGAPRTASMVVRFSGIPHAAPRPELVEADIPFAIVSIVGKGLGAQATRDIQQGERIFAEAPLVVCGSTAPRLSEVVGRLSAASRQIFFRSRSELC